MADASRGDELTAAEAFTLLASRGVPTLLWYAVYDPTESSAWVSEATDGLTSDPWHCRLVGDSSEGGLAGCGVLAAHLSPASVAAATAVAIELARAFAVVRPGLRLG
jgi:hypothetical protein